MSAEHEELTTVIHDAQWTDGRKFYRADGQLAEAILAAGYRKEFNVSHGLYRNKLGAEIEVLSLDVRPGIIGGVWTARQARDPFSSTLAVTADGLRDSGYTKVEACRGCSELLTADDIAYCGPCLLEMEDGDEDENSGEQP